MFPNYLGLVNKVLISLWISRGTKCCTSDVNQGYEVEREVREGPQG